MLQTLWACFAVRWSVALLVFAAFLWYLGFCVVDRAAYYARDVATDVEATDEGEGREDESSEPPPQANPPAPIQPPAITNPHPTLPQPAIPDFGSRIREALGGGQLSHSGSRGGPPFRPGPRVP